jgi:DNA polymerase-3 subunit epsilon
MEGTEFAVIDVETTSGDPLQGKITEFAVIVTNGKEEIERWSSIVDPGEPIPKFIQMLTGITNGMVRNAPKFDTCAPKLAAMITGRTIVAHNHRFDMTVLQEEFSRLGQEFASYVLCTEQLSRALVTDCEHYNLVSLSHHLNIPFKGHHRAMNDAQATASILSTIIERSGMAAITGMINYWGDQRRDLKRA